MNTESMELISGLIKKEILAQYGSMRKFSSEIGISSSTLTSAFQKNLSGTSIDTVINMCAKLDININELIKGNIVKNSVQPEPDYPRIGGINEDGNFVEEFSKEDSLEVIRDMAGLPKEALGELKIVFEFLDYKYNRRNV